MRRAIIAGAALGVAAGLLFIFHDAVQLTVAWPVVLGFALWGAVGRDGSRGLWVALAAAVGAAAGYAAYAVVAEWMAITRLSLGITAGVAVGVLALVGVWAGERFPMSGLLLGFAAFAGLFEPLWAESPAAVRTDGIETLTVAILALVVGVFAATLVRAVGERVQREATEQPRPEKPHEEPASPGVRDLFGGAS